MATNGIADYGCWRYCGYVIGWKPPAKRKMPNAAQMRGAAKAVERKAVKAFWQKADLHNELNLEWCKYFLERRQEYGEDSIQVVYAFAVAERLGFVFEEEVCE